MDTGQVKIEMWWGAGTAKKMDLGGNETKWLL